MNIQENNGAVSGVSRKVVTTKKSLQKGRLLARPLTDREEVANFRGIVPVACETADRWRDRPSRLEVESARD
jgi:hypothetical protein